MHPARVHRLAQRDGVRNGWGGTSAKHSAGLRPAVHAGSVHYDAITHVSLLPPPLELFTTRESGISATRVRPPGST